MEILELAKTILDKFFLAQKNGDNNGMVIAYREIVKVRNSLAESRGFSNYLELQKNFSHVPDSHWQKYITNREAFASKFSPRLDNSNNSLHFLSKIPIIDMEYPEGVYSFAAKKYPELNALRDKITITISNKDAYYRYSKEDDHYSIFISETNPNQKISMLIHELAHVISQEKNNHQIQGAYTDEFEAHHFEMDLAKDISEDFYRAVVGEYLMCFVRTEFQVSIFEKPELDPTSLYTSCFEKYIGKQNKENIYDFLSDKRITHLPLTDFSTAVALVNLLT